VQEPLAERPLGALHVAAVAIGAMIGVGIFFTPATLARAVPSPTWLLGLWVLGGVASVAGALVFVDLSVRWPRAGGLYVFLREGFGGPLGQALSFLYGWLQLLVVQPGAMAVIAVVLVDHVVYLTHPIAPAARAGAACAAILVFTVANLLGLRTGGRIQIGMATLKLGALALLIAVGIGWGHRAGVLARPPGPAIGTWSSWLLFGMIPVLFTFGGSYHATFVGGAVRDPERSIPRGIVGAIAAVLVAYLGVNVAYLALLGQPGLASSTSPAADAVGVALGGAAGRIVAAAIVLSAAGILNTVCLGFPFVVYAMAKDGVFFERAGRLNARTGRPTLAVALQGSLACVAVLVGAARVDVLLTGIAFADATFQAAVAVVHLRSTGRGPTGRRYAPALAAWTFLAIEVGVALGCLVRAPKESAYGAFALAAGAAAWVAWRRR
jgi:APA family basic amino acid/polyamine antiporter